METRTEYAQRPSTRQSRMKIDALLNPGEGDSYSDSPRSQHASIPSIHSYQHSPSFPQVQTTGMDDTTTPARVHYPAQPTAAAIAIAKAKVTTTQAQQLTTKAKANPTTCS
ncbi:hypothetical protein N7522_005969 [Penicillium canescens]|uniref:uncharacterized protein n=1 Tax=Penicillium canescens TaxID=5083 RepID=UPI0026DF0BE0|nr:uncharacterized protein N7446_011408 [Penicillium canescens]KAJ6004324.1 hypothetical protein N7522_005969 [Penicillium canescens]KAJ6048725.1 hypothetical protein N7446_011408 [Penicillium canescens]